MTRMSPSSNDHGEVIEASQVFALYARARTFASPLAHASACVGGAEHSSVTKEHPWAQHRLALPQPARTGLIKSW